MLRLSFAVWAPSLSSLTEVREETRGNKEEKEEKPDGSNGENRKLRIIKAASHVSYRRIKYCVCVCARVHVYLSVCKGTLAVVFLSDCVFQFL